jgi:hypothetical protein
MIDAIKVLLIKVPSENSTDRGGRGKISGMNPHRLSATIDEVESGFFNRWVEVPRIAARCCMCDTANARDRTCIRLQHSSGHLVAR